MFVSPEPSQSILEGIYNSPQTRAPEYMKVILFQWDINKKRPFDIFPLSMFTTNEIKDKWMESILDQNSRIRTLPMLRSLPGKTFSLFAKIERGKKLLKSTALLQQIHFGT